MCKSSWGSHVFIFSQVSWYKTQNNKNISLKFNSTQLKFKNFNQGMCLDRKPVGVCSPLARFPIGGDLVKTPLARSKHARSATPLEG